jgi:hypothetical protein
MRKQGLFRHSDYPANEEDAEPVARANDHSCHVSCCAGAAPAAVAAHLKRSAKMKPSKDSTFHAWFLLLLIIANGAAFLIAYSEQSWGALYISLIANPIMNLCFMALGCGPGVLFKKSERFKWGPHLAFCIVSPLITAILLFFSIFSLDLHGC